MPSRPTILAFDTSAAHCAAALLSAGTMRAETTRPMKRGQAEALMPLLEEMLDAHGMAWSDLNALAVGIGPGNFTGIRISVSAARGLALALGIPAVGVSMFEVMASDILGSAPGSGNALVSLPAPREMAYVQAFGRGRPEGAPQMIDPGSPPPELQMSFGMAVIGYRANDIAHRLEAVAVPTEIENLPQRIARIAERRLIVERETPGRPAPLYVRPADAAPPSDPPPVILP